MDDLPEQLDELAKQQQHDRPFKVITAAAAEIRSLREREVQAAEFICRKCGTRQNGPTDNEARF